MEKKCFLLLVLLLTARLFALDLEYKVVKDSAKCERKVMEADLKVQFANKNIKSLKVRAGEKIKYDTSADFYEITQSDVGYYGADSSRSILKAIGADNKSYYYALDDVVIENADKLPRMGKDKDIKYPRESLYMIPSYYYDVLKARNYEKIFEYEPYWLISDDNTYDWTDHFNPCYLTLTNTYGVIVYKDKSVSFLITNVTRTAENLYRIKIYVNEKHKSYEGNDPRFYDGANIYLKYDGDYVDVYINSFNDKIDTFVISSYNVREALRYTTYEYYDEIKDITWPRHADGTCDYDGSKKAHTATKPAAISSTPTINVAPNKTMSVKENLKLRSGEAATTSVLAVMSAGTRVKILTLGKQATIDGITSNWVQVEVQAGAKDRDGKPIAAGTTGWCFGGYLTER